MTKYNAGDILEILEDFSQLGAAYKSGDKYKVAAVTTTGYNLEPLQAGLPWSAHPGVFDPLEIVRKVEPKAVHMELGKSYTNHFNDLRYFVENFDFESGEVHTRFGQELEYESIWALGAIPKVFGVLPPEEPKEVPETIPVDALREALDFLGIQEVFDTENIISLAKRLS